MHLGQFGKIGTTNDAFTQSQQTFAGVVVRYTLFLLDENMAGANLLDRRLFIAATLVEELDDVKAIGAAQNVRDLAGFQRGKRFQKNCRQTAGRTPA